MEKVTRTFTNCGDLFEAILAAHKRDSSIRICLPKEIPAATNEDTTGIAPVMETRGAINDLEKCILLKMRMPGHEEVEFNVNSKPKMICDFSLDFSKETDYCGMY